MKTQKTLKALVLSLAMAMIALLPMTTQAQTDGFFRGGEDYENRDSDITLNGMNTQNFDTGAPLGGGLLIMVAAGAGYALLKKKED